MKTDLTAAECIAALRHCTDDSTELCVDDEYRCPLWNEDRMTDCCKADLMLAAADIIEAQLPKEDEWIIRETASGDVEAKCPKCGFEMLVNQPGNGLLIKEKGE